MFLYHLFHILNILKYLTITCNKLNLIHGVRMLIESSVYDFKFNSLFYKIIISLIYNF